MSEHKKTSVHEPLFHLAKRTNVNPLRATLIRIAAIVLGLVACGLVAFLLIEKLNQNPGKIGDFYNCFIKGSFSTERKLWKFLKNMAVLQCISLAVTPAFRMRFWNIGAEGQTLMGVLGAITMAFYFGGKVPEWQLLIMMFIAALIYGAVWAVIPALFKAKWNTNETLFTLMMNYVATQLASFFIIVWEVPKGAGKIGIINQSTKSGWLPELGNAYLLPILIVAIMTGVIYIYMQYSKHGYEISVVGESQRTASYAGIKVDRVIIRTMVLSGALCALIGFILTSGVDHTLTTTIVDSRGFTAVMVSWMSKFNPFIMIAASLLLVTMDRGATEVSSSLGLNHSFADILTGIILFFIIATEFFITYKISLRKSGKKEG